MSNLLQVVEDPDFKGGLLEADYEGKFLLFEPPLTQGEQYYLGVDVGSGQGLTNSVVQVLRMGNNGPDVQVGEYASNRIDPFSLAKVVYTLGHMYYCTSLDLPAMACVEINNYGLGTVHALGTEMAYANMFCARDYDSYQQKYVDTMGFKTTPATRKAIVTWGERAIRKGELIVHSPMLIEELASFDTAKALGAYDRDEEAQMVQEIIATARHKTGKKDDRILSILIAEWCCNDFRIAPAQSDQQREVELEGGEKDYRLMDISSKDIQADWTRKWGR